MTAERRQQPENVQDAVTATLRRLRGEMGNKRPEAVRVEPRFTSEPPRSVEEVLQRIGTSPARVANDPVPSEEDEYEPEPLNSTEPESDIPPTPSSLGSAYYEQVEDEAVPEETAAPRPRRHWLRYAVALLVVVVVGALVLAAYSHFARRASNGQIPIVTADQTPEKVQPAEAPPAQNQTQTETVYNQIAPSGSNTTQQPEVLLPQPEAPAAPPVPAPSSSSPSSSAPAPSAAAEAPSAVPSLAPATGSAVAAVPQTQTPPPSKPAVPPASTQTTQAAPSATTTTTSPAPSATGKYKIQLAASKSEADASRFWKQLSAKYPDVLGGLPVHIEKADLGTKGIYYRVQAGAFADKTAAHDLCEKLKAQGQQCLVKP